MNEIMPFIMGGIIFAVAMWHTFRRPRGGGRR